ncbi:flavin reductase family protein [Actinocorallia sp. A-T 12471]|uniref:flavin reductase family protein n=1 Tax=Actinocorallia sp. A-T 12471 TaxID=3089813 RepID=UPI0029D2BF18|nr:flavin reductase family protein [Actinocorallia sp. A-T 12471]MDX6742322.1 flavin reductase family protein [Actinocorallia sp. A-T 12471]
MSASTAASARHLRDVLGAFPSGVTALAARIDGNPVGIAASSFTSVSLDPPLVSVCVGADSRTWPVLSRAPRLGVSVLGADHGDACRRLSAKEGDRFAGLSWRETGQGAVLLDDAAAWFDCSIERRVPAGDHEIVVLEIHDYAGDAAVEPLVFHGGTFRRLAA